VLVVAAVIGLWLVWVSRLQPYSAPPQHLFQPGPSSAFGKKLTARQHAAGLERNSLGLPKGGSAALCVMDPSKSQALAYLVPVIDEISRVEIDSPAGQRLSWARSRQVTRVYLTWL
jgi:hypothetical protein